MIKPYENGGLVSVVDSVIHKVLIIDTTLRSFIPPQVRKIKIKLRHICGCEICIIPKDIQIDLNRFRTRLLTDLQNNYVGRHTHNILFSTTTAAHNKEKVFPDGEYLPDTIKYSAQ